MNRKQRIASKLSNELKDWKIIIIDNSHEHSGHNNFDGKSETHFIIKLKSLSSLKVNRIELHRKINLLLKDEFSSGLHALEISINN